MVLPPVLSVLAGLLVGSFLPYLPCSISLLILIVGLAVTWCERRGSIAARHGLVLVGSFIFGLVWWNGAAWWHGYHDLARWFEQPPVHIRGTIAERVHRTANRLVVVLDVSHVQEDSAWMPASGRLLLTWRASDHVLYPGDVVEFMARLRPPYGTLNPGGFNYAAYLSRKGIHAVASLQNSEAITVVSPTRISFQGWLWGTVDRWRDTIQEAATHTLKDPALGFFLAIMIGEQGLVAPETRDLFTATGTAHIVAISGMHLGLIAVLTFSLVKAGARRLPPTWLERIALWITPTRLAALTTVPMVALYALLAGGKTATIRALIMIVFAMAAVWMGRDRHLLRVLAIAACLLLLYDPPLLYDVSFQLSFVSVVAIVLWLQWQSQSLSDDELPDPPTRTRGQIWRVRAMQAAAVSLAATAATLPLVAYHFNQLAWLAPVANVFVVPFVGVVVIPLGLVSALWTICTGAETLPFATPLQASLDVLIDSIALMNRIPGVDWHVASPALISLAMFYALMTMAVRPRTHRVWRTVCLGGMLVLAVWWAWSPRWAWEAGFLRVAFLDIGQGDAMVIEFPDGQVAVIDGGPRYTRLDMGQAVIGPYLWDRGIRRIDHVIATHPQWDHIGGLAWLIRHFEVGHYWTNGIERPNPFYIRVKQAVQQAGLREEHAWEGREITRAGPCRLTVMNPLVFPEQTVRNAGLPSGSHLNNQSIVTQLDCGLHSFLFTADAERDVLRRLSHKPESRAARVIKVPHHGAKSSLAPEWINALTAETAIITVGRRNRYGHPASAVIEAYRRKGIRLYRTDRDGAVWITATMEDPQYVLHTARDYLLRPVVLDASILTVEAENWSRLWWKWMGET